MFWVQDIGVTPLLLSDFWQLTVKQVFPRNSDSEKVDEEKFASLIHVFWLGVVWYQLNQPIPTLLPSEIRLGRMRWELLASNGISPKLRGRFHRWQELRINLYHKDRLRFEKLAFKNNFHSLPPLHPLRELIFFICFSWLRCSFYYEASMYVAYVFCRVILRPSNQTNNKAKGIPAISSETWDALVYLM